MVIQTSSPLRPPPTPPCEGDACSEDFAEPLLPRGRRAAHGNRDPNRPGLCPVETAPKWEGDRQRPNNRYAASTGKGQTQAPLGRAGRVCGTLQASLRGPARAPPGTPRLTEPSPAPSHCCRWLQQLLSRLRPPSPTTEGPRARPVPDTTSQGPTEPREPPRQSLTRPGASSCPAAPPHPVPTPDMPVPQPSPQPFPALAAAPAPKTRPPARPPAALPDPGRRPPRPHSCGSGVSYPPSEPPLTFVFSARPSDARQCRVHEFPPWSPGFSSSGTRGALTS